MSPASSGGSPRSASGSDLGSFQMTASLLGLRVCDILCAPFPRPPVPLHAGLQSQRFWGLVFLAQVPQVGGPDAGRTQTPRSLGRASSAVLLLPGVGHLHGGVVFSIHPLALLLPSAYLSCGKPFLLVFRSFSLLPYLECLLEEVSSGSFHSTMLATP